jgi:hypothetical protein
MIASRATICGQHQAVAPVSTDRRSVHQTLQRIRANTHVFLTGFSDDSKVGSFNLPSSGQTGRNNLPQSHDGEMVFGLFERSEAQRSIATEWIGNLSDLRVAGKLLDKFNCALV